MGKAPCAGLLLTGGLEDHCEIKAGLGAVRTLDQHSKKPVCCLEEATGFEQVCGVVPRLHHALTCRRTKRKLVRLPKTLQRRGRATIQHKCKQTRLNGMKKDRQRCPNAEETRAGHHHLLTQWQQYSIRRAPSAAHIKPLERQPAPSRQWRQHAPQRPGSAPASGRG